MDKVLFGIYEEFTKDSNGNLIPNRVFVGIDGLPTHQKYEPIASIPDSADADLVLERSKMLFLMQKTLSSSRVPNRYEIRIQGEEIK